MGDVKRDVSPNDEFAANYLCLERSKHTLPRRALAAAELRSQLPTPAAITTAKRQNLAYSVSHRNIASSI
jgi:hypothetical protein